MKRLFIYCVLLSMFLACEDTSGVLEELGLPVKEFVVSETAEIVSVKYYANSQGSVKVLTDSPWVHLETSTFNEDGTLRISCEDNDGFPRMARIQFSLDRNPAYIAELTLKQEGRIKPYFTLPTPAVAVLNGTTEVSAEIITNVPADAITVKTRILDGAEEWVSAVNLTEDKVTVSIASDNPGTRKRAAAVSFVYDNGWGETVTSDLRITQAGNANEFGTELSFEQIRNMATNDGALLLEGILEAYVVSDNASGNVHENTQLSSKSIDYTVCRRSAYVQTLDGSYGFLLLMDSEEDNVFESDTKILLDLSEVLARRYDNPERYVLEHVSQLSLISTETAQIPVKKKKISELTPQDIYTRVTLDEVEWPIRKGSLTPGYEFMTNACNNDSATKYATLLRGKDGASMYMYTNTTCPYRRDGTKMGYGSGSVTGVIVHEKHRPFVDYDGTSEAEHGNIGDYQIRHMSRSDIQLADDFKDGFSEMICEFRYVIPYQHFYLDATYGVGKMSHTGPDSSSYNDYDFRGLTYYDFSYLGPIGNNANYFFGNNRGNENGFGIILEDEGRTNYGKSPEWSILANTDGRGRTNRFDEGNLAWGAVKWWDDILNRPYHWLVEFSTKDVKTDCLSMQIQMLNQCQNGYSPRYWKAEWSLSADTTDDTQWNQIGEEFTVPDVIPDNFDPATWMSSAFKPMNFSLPQEMLGHDAVYVRIGPSRNVASDRYGYANTKIAKDNYCGGTMNYFAIRYNR